MRGRRRAAQLAREVPPGDPPEQHEDDRREADAVIAARTSTTGSGSFVGINGSTTSHNSSRTCHIEAVTPPPQPRLCLHGKIRRRDSKPLSGQVF
jgi:hypothetical protein